MTNTFTKYAFANETEWATYQAQIQETNIGPDGTESKSYVGCAVVELGNIVLTPAIMGAAFEIKTPAVVSDKWAVDILFYAEPPASFAPFEVFPNPCGVHTFSGDDSLYLKTFCAKYPDSPYCVIPDDPAN
jgi:hypothetical protein